MIVEIPRFSGPEMVDIGHLFGQNKIEYDYKGVTTSVGRHGGTTEYILLVDDAYLVQAVDALVEYFGIMVEGDTAAEAKCPACDAEVKGLPECPDCGLFLCAGTHDQIKQHPFYKFLSSNGLLPY